MTPEKKMKNGSHSFRSARRGRAQLDFRVTDPGRGSYASAQCSFRGSRLLHPPMAGPDASSSPRTTSGANNGGHRMRQQHSQSGQPGTEQETSYEEIVPQSLNSEETKNHVVSFLNKAIPVTGIDNRRPFRLTEEQKVLETFFAEVAQKHNEELFSVEPSTKRARQATHCEEYEIHIQTAEKSLISVQSLLQKSSIPEWLPEKLYSIQTLLTKLQKSCQQDVVYNNP